MFAGKIFEYLVVWKPILCLIGEGVSPYFIRNPHTRVIAPPHDVAQIPQRQVEMYRQWQNGTLGVVPDKQLIQSFERRQLTGRLAGIFNQLTGKAV